MAGVSLVSILQAGDWAIVSTSARDYFSPYCIQDSVQTVVLGFSE